jgi:hypothetical protein
MPVRRRSSGACDSTGFSVGIVCGASCPKPHFCVHTRDMLLRSHKPRLPLASATTASGSSRSVRSVEVGISRE